MEFTPHVPLTLSTDELNTVLDALTELPWKRANPIIASLHVQHAAHQRTQAELARKRDLERGERIAAERAEAERQMAGVVLTPALQEAAADPDPAIAPYPDGIPAIPIADEL